MVALAMVVSAGLATGQETNITNYRVIQLSKMGLDDEVIIAKIKTGRCNFSLGDNDLLELKKAGVSGKVVAAMVEASVLTSPRVKVDGKPVELHTISQAKVGGRLGHTASMRIMPVREEAYLQGRHAAVIASPNPKIEIELPLSDSIDNYILVRMDRRGDRRELEVGSAGGSVGRKTGIRAESIVKTSHEPVSDRVYRIFTEKELKGGEYILYVVGSAHYEEGVFGKGYDFTVE